MDSNNFSSLFSLLLWIFQIAAFLLSLVLDILLNILGIALLILLFILHIIISIVYAILLPAGMVALGVFGLIEDKSVTNIAIIILDVCLAVLFYIVLIV